MITVIIVRKNRKLYNRHLKKVSDLLPKKSNKLSRERAIEVSSGRKLIFSFMEILSFQAFHLTPR